MGFASSFFVHILRAVNNVFSRYSHGFVTFLYILNENYKTTFSHLSGFPCNQANKYMTEKGPYYNMVLFQSRIITLHHVIITVHSVLIIKLLLEVCSYNPFHQVYL